MGHIGAYGISPLYTLFCTLYRTRTPVSPGWPCNLYLRPRGDPLTRLRAGLPLNGPHGQIQGQNHGHMWQNQDTGTAGGAGRVYPGWWGRVAPETRTDQGGDECIYGGARQARLGPDSAQNQY